MKRASGSLVGIGLIGWKKAPLVVLAAATAAIGFGLAQPTAVRTQEAAAPAPLARYLPRQDLVAYLEFEGLDAHPTAWKKAAAQRLLNDTKLGSLVEDLAGQVAKLAQQSTPEEKRIAASEYLSVLKRAAHDGFALGVFGKAPQNEQVAVMFRKGARPEVIRLLDQVAGISDPGPQTIQKSGRTVHPLGPGGAWWDEKGDLILTSLASVETITSALDGKQPAATEHPLRAPLLKGEPGFEPAAYGFVDISAFPPMPPDALKMGLDGLKRVELQWGFQDKALLTSVRLVAPAPRRGALAFLDQPTFSLKSLPSIPAGQSAFAVVSIDMGKTYDQFIALTKESNPANAEGLDAMENAIRAQFGLDLRTDVLKHLGPRLALYSTGVGAPAVADLGNPMAVLAQSYAGLTVSLEVKDQEAFSKPLETLVNGINQILAQQGGGNGPQFHKKDGAGQAYVLEFPAGAAPDGPLGKLTPTIALDKQQLVISGTSEGADKALAVAAGPTSGRWSPTGAYGLVAERLARELIALVLTDPRETLPVVIENLPQVVEAIRTQMANSPAGAPGPPFDLRIDPEKLPKADDLRPLLFPSSAAVSVDAQGLRFVQREALPSFTSPATVGVLAGLLMPATVSAREAARRAQCTNNIKQMMLAMHNHAAANNNFPRDITDKDGKPLLSWRVAILPYIEQNDLYTKFKLDEPWDSPNNKPLLAEMPKIFICPSIVHPQPDRTTYRGFVGSGALFETGQDIGLASITDGTSNTIAIVEATEAVPWSKPEDLPFDQAANPSLYGAGSLHPGGFNCGFCDGSVRFIKSTIQTIVFKALITRAGGEAIQADAF